ncbi:MAG: acyl transferase [Bacteroidota bacterium]
MVPFEANSVFQIANQEEFQNKALQLFRYQAAHNPVYRSFCQYLNTNVSAIRALENIPFLPIAFFKSKKVVSGSPVTPTRFTSSGTTGTTRSTHFVADIELYRKSYSTAFSLFYGPPKDYCILALLPSYLEREGSSLIYMVDDLIAQSRHPDSGFYLNDLQALKRKIRYLEQQQTKTLLLGVSFALMDLASHFKGQLKHTILMETGGMKGRRKEMVRYELHHILKQAFGVATIHSEYGMTELLSQAYSSGEGTFRCPPWMTVVSRDPEDPLSPQLTGKTGGLNIIDLANIHSCAFIATQDLGKVYPDGTFEVLGRFDHAEIRGCNLMVF